MFGIFISLSPPIFFRLLMNKMRQEKYRINYFQKLLGIGEFIIASEEERKKATLIFSTIGFVILILYGIYMSGLEDPRLAMQGKFMIVGSILLPLPVAIFSYFKIFSAQTIENLLIFVGFVVFFTLSVFGGFYADCLYWSFVLPYLIFFIGGQRKGWFIGTTYAITLPITLHFTSKYSYFWQYEDIQLPLFGMAFFFNIITAAYFNLLRNDFQSRLQALVELNTQEARRYLQALEHQAIHDVSTGLLNRQGLIEKLSTLSNHHQNVCVITLKFSRIQELVNIVGLDNVNQAIKSLTDQIPGRFTNLLGLGRCYLDEITIILNNVDNELELIEALRQIEDTKGPNEVVGFHIQSEISFGLTFQNTFNKLAPPDELLNQAEQALLNAIREKSTYKIFNNKLESQLIEYNVLYDFIHEALKNNKFQLHYQPQTNISSGKLIGAEALARLEGNSGRPVSPSMFIPIIESTGLLKRFTIWTIRSAIRDCKNWQDQFPGVTVSINLSADALLDNDVNKELSQAVKYYDLSPSLVIIEMTESVMMKNKDIAITKLNHMTQQGFCLSIDDFGTGYSSLEYIKYLPAKELKIDQSFIFKLCSSREDFNIVESTILLGHKFGFIVLAEGVENEATLNQLKELGCDCAQGYLFAKPLPLSDFIKWGQNKI
jgi:EAL domain-containing protein (putative c-di-GMP-specific phosphodiesterase class I)/GGDEF domain-containing protein